MEIISENDYTITYAEVVDNKNKVYTMYNIGKRMAHGESNPASDIWKLVEYEEYDFLSNDKITINARYEEKYGLLKNLHLYKNNFVRNIVLDNGNVISDSTWDIDTDETKDLLVYNPNAEHLHIFDYLNNDRSIETNGLLNKFFLDHSNLLAKMNSNDNGHKVNRLK